MKPPEHKTLVRQLCRIYHLWPEATEITQSDVQIPCSGGVDRTISLVVRTFLNRQNFVEPSEAVNVDFGYSYIRLAKESGFWRGNTVVLEGKKGDAVADMEVVQPHQGEIYIGVAFDDFADSHNLIAISQDMVDIAILVLNLVLYECLVQVGQIQAVGPDHNSSNNAGHIHIERRERRIVSTEDIKNGLSIYSSVINTLSLEELRGLAVATRRFNAATAENDIIDEYCDYWECCEFLAPAGKTIKGLKLNGHKNTAIAQMICAYTKAPNKQSVYNEIKDLYDIRNDIVHNAVEDAYTVSQKIKMLRERALQLFRFRMDI
jgi:hypothetical protein